jgi:ATP-dependent DNA ligase
MARAVAGRRSDPVALPNWILPQLTQLVDAAPEGDDWLHEIKYDGYRMHARLDRGTVKLLTRTGLDWTHKYPPIAEAVASLGPRQAYLDGELCGTFPEGGLLGALLLAYYDPDGRLVYAGRAGTGMNDAELQRLWRRSQLLAEVKFLTWTDDNLLRQVVYAGLREDKISRRAEVLRDVPRL